MLSGHLGVQYLLPILLSAGQTAQSLEVTSIHSGNAFLIVLMNNSH